MTGDLIRKMLATFTGPTATTCEHCHSAPADPGCATSTAALCRECSTKHVRACVNCGERMLTPDHDGSKILCIECYRAADHSSDDVADICEQCRLYPAEFDTPDDVPICRQCAKKLFGDRVR